MTTQTIQTVKPAKTIQQTINLYTFDQLTKDAQRKAIEQSADYELINIQIQDTLDCLKFELGRSGHEISDYSVDLYDPSYVRLKDQIQYTEIDDVIDSLACYRTIDKGQFKTLAQIFSEVFNDCDLTNRFSDLEQQALELVEEMYHFSYDCYNLYIEDEGILESEQVNDLYDIIKANNQDCLFKAMEKLALELTKNAESTTEIIEGILAEYLKDQLEYYNSDEYIIGEIEFKQEGDRLLFKEDGSVYWL